MGRHVNRIPIHALADRQAVSRSHADTGCAWEACAGSQHPAHAARPVRRKQDILPQRRPPVTERGARACRFLATANESCRGANLPARRPCLIMSSTSSTVRVRTYAATWSHRFAVPCRDARAPLAARPGYLARAVRMHARTRPTLPQPTPLGARCSGAPARRSAAGETCANRRPPATPHYPNATAQAQAPRLREAVQRLLQQPDLLVAPLARARRTRALRLALGRLLGRGGAPRGLLARARRAIQRRLHLAHARLRRRARSADNPRVWQGLADPACPKAGCGPLQAALGPCLPDAAQCAPAAALQNTPGTLAITQNKRTAGRAGARGRTGRRTCHVWGLSSRSPAGPARLHGGLLGRL